MLPIVMFLTPTLHGSVISCLLLCFALRGSDRIFLDRPVSFVCIQTEWQQIFSTRYLFKWLYKLSLIVVLRNHINYSIPFTYGVLLRGDHARTPGDGEISGVQMVIDGRSTNQVLHTEDSVDYMKHWFTILRANSQVLWISWQIDSLPFKGILLFVPFKSSRLVSPSVN